MSFTRQVFFFNMPPKRRSYDEKPEKIQLIHTVGIPPQFRIVYPDHKKLMDKKKNGWTFDQYEQNWEKTRDWLAQNNATVENTNKLDMDALMSMMVFETDTAFEQHTLFVRRNEAIIETHDAGLSLDEACKDPRISMDPARLARYKRQLKLISSAYGEETSL